eukprot:CAMPEP_0201721008 /NCGR_PEP_ID=MMETSP0593-20130828/5821_1 /ASSEMBLY_ACC=CAM_ASM_000672 /TAXON_ID=267983 /ORGANISM="Skeletonema japonicum, Strain CCMP2506" /LENGTH=523 /DNA_ID=CAMNT_0048211753 /DNA_START=40 /DNA_END=1611 /DNA_ORIENTATION=+
MKFTCPSNVAILSLLAASSGDAFAPSSTTSMTSTIRLQAGSNELTGLLGEYSGSLPSSPAVTKTVEKVAEVVASAPAAAPVAADSVSKINEAAAVAQSAADHAASAAASLAASSVPAMKAAAVPAIKAAATGAVAGGASSIKPLVGGVFVKVDSAKINPDMQFDASSRAQENLGLLKANFIAGLGGLGSGLSDLQLPKIEGGTDSGVSGVDLSAYSAADLQAIVDSLQLKEYGGWYAAAAMAIIASQQKSSGKQEAAAEFESELTLAQQKANDAASAAGMAAEGAKLAKKLAMKMEKETKKDGGQAILESTKTKQILLEKESMEQKVRELQAELVKLNSRLEQANEGKKKAVKAVTAKKTEIEEEYPSKVTLEGDPEEEARIIEILKMMDEENKVKKAKAAAEAEKKREEEAKYVKSQKNIIDEKMTKGVEAAQAKAEVASKKKRTTKKKKSTAPKAKAKTSAKKKTVTKKAASSSIDDWTQLADSTLKRKTIAQLTEYLTEKGVSIEKSMKKADLLNAVKSL